MIDSTGNPIADPIINAFNKILPKLPGLVVAIIFGIALVRVLSWITKGLLSLVKMPAGLRSIIHSLVDALFWIFLIITVLKAAGLGEIAIVLSGGLAAAGLAMAAGGASLASDVIAGIFLAKDRDFSVGDEVVAGEDKTEGVIEGMDMRRTRIRGTDGRLHVIPNSVVERKEWVLIAKKRERAAEAQTKGA